MCFLGGLYQVWLKDFDMSNMATMGMAICYIWPCNKRMKPVVHLLIVFMFYNYYYLNIADIPYYLFLNVYNTQLSNMGPSWLLS